MNHGKIELLLEVSAIQTVIVLRWAAVEQIKSLARNVLMKGFTFFEYSLFLFCKSKNQTNSQKVEQFFLNRYFFCFIICWGRNRRFDFWKCNLFCSNNNLFDVMWVCCPVDQEWKAMVFIFVYVPCSFPVRDSILFSYVQKAVSSPRMDRLLASTFPVGYRLVLSLRHRILRCREPTLEWLRTSKLQSHRNILL